MDGQAMIVIRQVRMAKLEIGSLVRWNDPAIEDYDPKERKEALRRIFEVYAIDDDIISIKEVDGCTEADVYEDELVQVK